MSKKIKNSHVLIIGSGPSLKKNWDKIENFIKNNDIVIFGCNYITDFLVPDYHFWGSVKRWNKYSRYIDKEKSILVVSEEFRKNKKYGKLLKKWGKNYLVFKDVKKRWKFGSENKKSKEFKDCEVCYKDGIMYGCFYDISTRSIFYAYINGASKISVIGNDGYTLYKKNDLEKNKESQHCYGEGFTDGFTYRYCRKKDWDKYRTLRLLYKYCKKKYGFGFEIITPTIYGDFYNSDILNILENPCWQKWEEPTKKEYKNMYVEYIKDRKIKNPEY